MRYLLLITVFFVPFMAHIAMAEELTVKPVMLADQKAVYGTVESIKTTPARARIEGTIESLNVAEGDQVQAGQVIAKIYDSKLKLKLEALDSRIKSLKSEKELAQTALNRSQALIRSGAESQAFLDKAKAANESVSGALAAAIAERGVTAEQRNEADVLAPTAGRVLKVNVVNGAIIRPGESLAEIATSASVLRLLLPERHARFIKVGDKVLIGERGASGDNSSHKIEGRARLVYPELQQGRVMADIEADSLAGYFVGERALVTISTGNRETFVIPSSYLLRRFSLTFARFKDGRELPVQIGQTLGENTEVLSGLKDGDILVKP